MPCNGIEFLAALSAPLYKLPKTTCRTHLLRSAIDAGTILDAETRKSVKGKKYEEECLTTPRDQAEWKKTAEGLFEDFRRRCENRRGARSPFAAIAQAKVPTTSKKVFKLKR